MLLIHSGPPSPGARVGIDGGREEVFPPKRGAVARKRTRPPFSTPTPARAARHRPTGHTLPCPVPLRLGLVLPTNALVPPPLSARSWSRREGEGPCAKETTGPDKG